MLSVGVPGEQIRQTGIDADLVRISQVTKSFGEKIALKDISFSVSAGQICALLGPNGAGKTTLFRLLMGILKATNGNIFVDGRDTFEERVEVKRIIGYLPDEPIFYSYLSGREILELSAGLHGLEVGAAMDRLRPAITRMRLADDIDNYAEDLSRGMKKKLGLLLALVHQSFWCWMSRPMASTSKPSTIFAK